MKKRITAFVLSALMIFGSTLTFLPAFVSAAPLEKTYTFSELKSTMEYGLTSEVTSDGTLKITFNDQYKSQFYAIPDDIDPSTITNLKFDVTSKNAGDLAFKFHTQEDYDSDNKNGTPVSYGKPEVAPSAGDKVKYFSIMSLNTGTTEATIASVTFSLSGEGNPGADDEPDNGPSVEGENLLLNGDFADGDVSMFGAEQGSAKITTASQDTPIYGEVTTYGVISDRTRPYDCFAYDVTDIVENGSTYAYCFYIKLSDAYEGAPGTQRQVDFAPYITTTDGNTNYLGSYSPEISGSSSQQLTPGEWTKYEGTFKVASAGEIEKIVLRFLEQGEDYGEGACVMGEYYITGVSLIDLHIGGGAIETNVPDLKDTFISDFGEDMIVGTSIVNSELSDKALMNLVTKHFNAITIGNELKPDSHLGGSAPKETEKATIDGQEIDVPVLNFHNGEQVLDYLLTWNEENPDNQIKVRGHVLTWHSQTPEWFFHEDYDTSKPLVTPEVMTLRHEWYIKSILEHYCGADSKYKDLFYGWDVVNEAVSDATGTYRNDSEGSNWWAVYKSNEFIINAFRFANKYAPADVELYYNDYNDSTPGKVDAIVTLLNDVKNAEGTRIDGMGMQGHYNIDSPTMEQFEDAARKYSAVVGKVMLTELDFKASTGYDGTEATLQGEYSRQAYAYKNLYQSMKKLNDEGIKVSGFTVWGVIDGNSWLQAYTGVGGGVTDGRPQCPLLFDDNYKVKPAFWAIVDPTKLAPEILTMEILEMDDFDLANEYSLGEGEVSATFKPIWKDGEVKVLVNVNDASEDADDSVTVYIDKYNSKSTGIKTKAVSVTRAEGTKTDAGYSVEISVPFEEATKNKTIGFDVVVNDNGTLIAFNDSTLAQDTSSKYYAEATLVPIMTIVKGTAVIDGELDEAWNNAIEVSLDNGTDNPVATATAKVMWDKDYLYVFMDVTDPELNKSSEQVHEQDSVEVFIDETNSKAQEYNAATKQYRINYENEHSFNGEKCVEENETTAVKITENGYVFEGAFKWTEITPAGGENIGIELQINDADGTGFRIGTKTWKDTSNQCYACPAFFGTAVLSDGSDKASGSEGTTAGNSKVGLVVGIAAAAALAGAASFFALKGNSDAEGEKTEETTEKTTEETNEDSIEAEEAKEEALEEKADDADSEEKTE